MASDGKYAFVEMRTEELCTMAMQLDKVQLCGRVVRWARGGVGGGDVGDVGNRGVRVALGFVGAGHGAVVAGVAVVRAERG